MLKQVEVEIIAKVRTILKLNDDESLEELKNRTVDIYVHGFGIDGYLNKTDVGATSCDIQIIHTK